MSDKVIPCCMGSAVYGDGGCTCGAGVTETMIGDALFATVPGGAKVWEFLPQKDAFTPADVAWDVMRAALKAAFKEVRA